MASGKRSTPSTRGERPSLARCLREERLHLGDTAVYSLILMVICLVWVRAGSGIQIFYPESGSPTLPELITFFTGNDKECRAWTLRKGSNAREAAGVIHTDMEKGFIRAEVVSFEDIITYGSTAEARAKGRLRVEGKNYIVQDGDILEIRFNI